MLPHQCQYAFAVLCQKSAVVRDTINVVMYKNSSYSFLFSNAKIFYILFQDKEDLKTL